MGKIKFGIIPRLLLTMIIVAIIPLAANWYSHRQSSIKRLSDQVDRSLSTKLESTADYVNTWIDMNTKLLKQNAALEEIASMNPEKQVTILKSILDEYGEWIRTANTLTLNGQNIARGDNQKLTFLGDRQWFREALSNTALGADLVVSRTHGNPTCVLAAPIFNRDQKAVGVIQVGFSLESVSKNVVDKKIGQTGYAYLLDDKGRVVAHGKKEYTQVLANLSKHPVFQNMQNAAKTEKKKLIFVDNITEKKVISYAQRTKLGWILVVQQNYDEAYAAVNEANQNAILILAVTLLFVILVSPLVAHRLSRPIVNLTYASDNISRGNLQVTIKEINRSDEIGELARAIERLGTSMKLAIKRLSRH